MEHKFKSINNFGNMYRHASGMFEEDKEYQIKPKLHGSNVSVHIKDGQFSVRSKNRVLAADDDHMNAYKALEEEKDYFLRWAGELEVVFMGEWAGEGVHRGATDAVCTLEGKCLYIFAVMVNGRIKTDFTVNALKGMTEDTDLIKWVPTLNVINIPMNITKPVQPAVDWINDRVEDFEVRDEYICDLYDLPDIHGEGIVGVLNNCSFDDYFKYAFKAKTEAHQVKKAKAPAMAKEPIPQDALNFAHTFATEARIKQAIDELGVELDMRHTGDVIKWMNDDIQKESIDELKDMECEWKHVAKATNTVIVQIWKEMVNNV